ncbi:hypothetical protein [Eubacterium limosum]|uniref:hypothetical protein n=1 Tax=Eubacterium limosum TaxID=1736 RepID=UPI001063486E|nr:hypothetical protein [Eubacterium limosum]
MQNKKGYEIYKLIGKTLRDNLIQLIVSVVVSLCLVITAYIFGEQITNGSLLIICIVALAIIICNFVIVALMMRTMYTDIFDTFNQKLELYLQHTIFDDFDFYTPEDLCALELDGLDNVTSIWLAGSDLQWDCNNGIFRDVVQKNLKKNIEYSYYGPKSDLIFGQFRIIKEFNEQYKKNLKFYSVNDASLFFERNVDFTLYNPIPKQNQERVGYMGITLLSKTGSKHFMHVKMDDELVNVLVGKLMAMRVEFNE